MKFESDVAVFKREQAVEQDDMSAKTIISCCYCRILINGCKRLSIDKQNDHLSKGAAAAAATAA